MNLLRALFALALALAGQAAVGQWSPSLLRYVDLLMMPVAWYALARSQRSAMLIGCAAGALEDAWFQAGIFGLRGFNKTLLGWLLGGLGARVDLNVAWGRGVAGAALPVVDRLCELGLLRLLDLSPGRLDPVELLGRAVAGGLLTLGVFAIVDRAGPAKSRAGRRGRRLPR